MDPLDYLKILQRHWKVAAALLAVALLAAFITSPSQPAQVYEAEHILLRDQASGDESTMSADNPSVVALWATAGEVPERVAEKLRFSGPVEELAGRLTVTPDVDLSTVEMVATAESPDEAVLTVNTFAAELLAFIAARDAARVNEMQAETTQRSDELRAEIQRYGEAIAAAGGPTAPAAAGSVAQRDAAIAELGSLAAEAATETRTTTLWTSLQTATSADEASDSVVGATRGQRMLLAALVALLLAFGVAIMLDRSDSRLHSKEQAEREFGLPVLAEAPLLPIRHRRRAAVFGYDHDHGLAEAYRALRTALLLFRDRLPLELEAADLSAKHRPRAAARGVDRQVIVVTSPEAGDGKSTTAANLAMAYAEADQSVLLINWDRWRPVSARIFDAEDGPGVGEYLESGEVPLQEFVQSTSVPGVHLVHAGKGKQRGATRLHTRQRLFEEARSLAEVVIIDTAPLLASSATRELVTLADVVVLASRSGRTTSVAARRTAELLRRLGAPTLGVVLVGVPTGPFTEYYGSPTSRTEAWLNLGLGRGEAAGGSRRAPSPANGHNGNDDRARRQVGPPSDGTNR